MIKRPYRYHIHQTGNGLWFGTRHDVDNNVAYLTHGHTFKNEDLHFHDVEGDGTARFATEELCRQAMQCVMSIDGKRVVKTIEVFL